MSPTCNFIFPSSHYIFKKNKRSKETGLTHFSNMVQLTQNRSKIVTFQHLNIKNRYFSSFFQTKSSKSVVHSTVRIAHLSSEQPLSGQQWLVAEGLDSAAAGHTPSASDGGSQLSHLLVCQVL